MNNRVFKQLQQVKSVNLEFDKDTTYIKIPKTEVIVAEAIEVGKVYHIEISDEIINPASGSTLASNWNGGRIPKNKEYIAELVKIVSNMYQWNGVAVNDQLDNFFGYIPKNSFKIKEIV